MGHVDGTAGCAGGPCSCTRGTGGTAGDITGVVEVWMALHQPYLFIFRIM